MFKVMSLHLAHLTANMMYKSFSLIFFLAFAQIAIAQETQQSKFYIGVGSGVAFPLGDFKKTDELHNSGSADISQVFLKYELGYRFHSHFGIRASFSKFTFPINEKRIPWENGYGFTYTEGDPIDLAVLQGGPTFNINLGKFELILKTSIGYSWSPYAIKRITREGAPAYGGLSSQSQDFKLESEALVLGGGISIGYSMGKRWLIFIECEYIWSEHSHYDKYGSYSIQGALYPNEDFGTELAYQFVGTDLGITFKL